MSNRPYFELASNELEIAKFLPRSRRTKFSAFYTENRILGREEAEKCLQADRIGDPWHKNKGANEEIEVFLNKGGQGMDLTFDEEHLIHGIASIFTMYDYETNYIECTERGLMKAMRCEKNLSGWKRQDYRRALESLSNKKFPIYWTERSGWRWVTFDTIIKLAWGVKIKDGNLEFKNVPTRKNFSRYRIAFNKLLVGTLTKNFRLANPEIFNEIREYKARINKKPSKYDIRFYYLLLHENKQEIKRNYLKIARAPMLMEHLIKDRKFKELRDRLNSIYRMYYDLRYLSNYHIDYEGAKHNIDILYLNKEKFYQFRDEK